MSSSSAAWSLISADNPVFRNYAVWTGALLLKTLGMSALTGVMRFKNHTFANPEDTLMHKVEVKHNDDEVERVRRYSLQHNIIRWSLNVPFVQSPPQRPGERRTADHHRLRVRADRSVRGACHPAVPGGRDVSHCAHARLCGVRGAAAGAGHRLVRAVGHHRSHGLPNYAAFLVVRGGARAEQEFRRIERKCNV